MNNKITVIFDIKRLYDARQNLAIYKGITKYASVLYQNFYFNNRIELVSVIYANDELYKISHDLSILLLNDSNIDFASKTINYYILLFLNISIKKSSFIFNRLKFLFFLKKLYNFISTKLTKMQIDELHELQKLNKSDLYKLQNPVIYFSPVNPLPSKKFTNDIISILTVNDCIYLKRPDFYTTPKQIPPIKYALDSICHDKDYAICISEYTKKDLIELSGMPQEKIKVIYDAADEVFFFPDRKIADIFLEKQNLNKNKYIIALAQEEKRKNIDILLYAFLLIKDDIKYNDYFLLLIGNNNIFQGIIKKILENFNKECHYNSFKCVDFVDEKTLAALYNKASLFVYPSLYEGFGIPVLEAMAAGCPVIVGKNSSIPEVAGEAGYYTNVEDEVDLMNAIKVVLSDNELRNTLIKKGKKQARKFSWNKTIKETIDFMFEVTHKIPLKK